MAVRPGGASTGTRHVADEVPVALVYDGTTHAVLMATPDEIEDLALGFSLTEAIVARRDEIAAIEIAPHALGIEARIWLAPDFGRTLDERRRAITGPSGCGLCGVESLAAATRSPPPVVAGGPRLDAAQVHEAVRALASRQPLGAATRAVHAAGFWTPDEGLLAVREDVGRHNALDKLVGALARRGRDGTGGVVVLTSRVSVEMVQKAARLGAPVIVAVSAPTALAIDTAAAAGMTLIAVARDDGFEVFTGHQRVLAASG